MEKPNIDPNTKNYNYPITSNEKPQSTSKTTKSETTSKVEASAAKSLGDLTNVNDSPRTKKYTASKDNPNSKADANPKIEGMIKLTPMTGTYGSTSINEDGSFATSFGETKLPLGETQLLNNDFVYGITDGREDAYVPVLEGPIPNPDDIPESETSYIGNFGTLLLKPDGTFSYTFNNTRSEALSQGQIVRDFFGKNNDFIILIRGTNDEPTAKIFNPSDPADIK